MTLNTANLISTPSLPHKTNSDFNCVKEKKQKTKKERAKQINAINQLLY